MKRRDIPALGLAVLTLGVDLALAVPALRYGAAFSLLWLAPGLAWAVHLAQGRWPSVEEGAVGLGFGLGTTSLLTLIISYVPGPFAAWILTLSVNLLALSPLLLLVLRGRRGDTEGPSTEARPLLVALAVVLLFSVLLRLVNIGYSEFQGDEGVIMMRAAAILRGDPDQLFLHQKGPMEVLIPTATWALSGTIDEAGARLPFVLSALLGSGAVFLLGRRLFNRRVGLVGGLLLAANGYFVAFGRIVQYQSIVLATTALGILSLWIWQEGQGRRWLLVGASLLALGLLAHYDAVLALPAALYLVGRRLWRQEGELRRHLPGLIGAAALGLIIVALFYVPFALHPNFAKTLSYLSEERMGTGGPVYNNLLSSLPLTMLYNSTYYVLFIALAVVAAAFRPFRRWEIAIPSVCVLAIVVVTGLAASPWLVVGALVALVGAILACRRTSHPQRVIWLWFAVPFLFHYFLVWDPRTHVLNAFTAASLLAALPLDGLWKWGRRRGMGRVLIPLGLVLYVLFGYYTWMMFVDHTPEVQRTWPENRNPLYWTPYEELPRFGLFGFPHRAGWKAVGALMAQGDLAGVYASNEEEEITRWYTRAAERSYCPDPDLYLIASNVQDEIPVDEADLEADYRMAGGVRVDGAVRLRIYRPSADLDSLSTYDAQTFERRFDATMEPEALAPYTLSDVVPVDAVLGDRVRLIGYRLDAGEARSGGVVRLTLYWEALEPMQTSYQIFTHLYDGTMWGQHDSAPGCGLWPTTRWEPGQWVRDDHVLSIAPDAPAGEIPLWIGMYDLGSGARLPVTQFEGQVREGAVRLTTVNLR